ncbi:jg7182 [Pararge aegeria aegeria]|uniref:Jg7182 protein n=1 Tax=Pararge aegeria aegeria TaxID=348720 RepID=A0A8S4R6W0_9NEOP|nr:jg7182 [Pararge aegeria aegeria]
MFSKGVWSPPIGTVPAWWITALTTSQCGRRPVPCSGLVMDLYDGTCIRYDRGFVEGWRGQRGAGAGAVARKGKHVEAHRGFDARVNSQAECACADEEECGCGVGRERDEVPTRAARGQRTFETAVMRPPARAPDSTFLNATATDPRRATPLRHGQTPIA